MAGELDDPLLMASVPYGESRVSKGQMVAGAEDSSMGMNGGQDSAMSIGKMVDDSELSNGIVGVKSRQEKKEAKKKVDVVKKVKKDKDKKKKAKKEKKKKKKREREIASDDDSEKKVKKKKKKKKKMLMKVKVKKKRAPVVVATAVVIVEAARRSVADEDRLDARPIAFASLRRKR